MQNLLMNEKLIEEARNKKGFICDMDGVIYHGKQLLPGAKEFVDWIHKENKSFLFLTNNSERSPKELKQKLARMGLDLEEKDFYTSGNATANFLKRQSPGCSAYVIGGNGLLTALDQAGIVMDDINPDYVIVGETDNYNYNNIVKAVTLIHKGARLIATNTDLTCPTEIGIIPACRALVSPIELTTGKSAYYMGKPNPLMMRTGLRILGIHSEDACMIGDRMDTDIIAGLESGLTTCLTLTGVTDMENIKQFAYQPSLIVNGIGDLVPR